MESSGLKQRHPESMPGHSFAAVGNLSKSASDRHPAGEVKHGRWTQLIRMLLFATWFIGCCVLIHITQLLGAPLYFINKDYFYAWVALTKQSFAVVIITITEWFAPTLVRVSGDASVRGQIRRSADGRVETDFPERLILISNHQIYTDWLYLWCIAYTSRLHGHIYIILKEGLKYVPLAGPGMMLFGFVFMKRNWASDKARMQHRLTKLKGRHGGPMAGSESLDPMWLLIYPEGTNLSADTRKVSKKWADRNNIPDLKRQLLPRSTGLLFCLQELRGTVDWIYDCTVAYEGTP
jgi:1-acyl-sn-glycerol-3-phosphate acyltransferase